MPEHDREHSPDRIWSISMKSLLLLLLFQSVMNGNNLVPETGRIHDVDDTAF